MNALYRDIRYVAEFAAKTFASKNDETARRVKVKRVPHRRINAKMKKSKNRKDGTDSGMING